MLGLVSKRFVFCKSGGFERRVREGCGEKQVSVFPLHNFAPVSRSLFISRSLGESDSEG